MTIAKSILIDQLNVAMTSIRFPTTRRRPRRPVRRDFRRFAYQGNPDAQARGYGASEVPDAGAIRMSVRMKDEQMAARPRCFDHAGASASRRGVTVNDVRGCNRRCRRQAGAVNRKEKHAGPSIGANMMRC
ncbi:hypothetical protein [Burkholderia anthina]|uniref:hypothetical protein n=1 Tax=Burkholderia anthina TaxID=179879 RepID=UPI0037C14D1F